MGARIDQIGGAALLRPLEPGGRTLGAAGNNDGQSFAEVLNRNMAAKGELKISQHAQERLQRRNIQLTGEDYTKIEKAVQTAKEKGSKDSLVLLDNFAFIVSVKNSTIVTAMERQEQAQRVFTNIDSVVLA